jgi:hypothetical protein
MANNSIKGASNGGIIAQSIRDMDDAFEEYTVRRCSSDCLLQVSDRM